MVAFLLPLTGEIKQLNMLNQTKVAIDLGGTNIRVGKISEGKLTSKLAEELHEKENLEATLFQLKKIIRKAFSPDATGIGIGVPSVVDVEKGIVYNVANIPSWVEVHLKDILEAEFNVPVYINNDVNCFVLGEQAYGVAKNCKSVVGLTIGTGLGAGIFLNGQLYAGENCGAGEIGCLPYLDKDLEFYSSSAFFNVLHKTTAKEQFEKAGMGDVTALKRWEEFGVHVAQAIKNVVFAYDPQMVVLGGSISKAFPYFSGSMRESLNDFPYPKSMEKLRINLSENDDINLFGASMLI